MMRGIVRVSAVAALLWGAGTLEPRSTAAGPPASRPAMRVVRAPVRGGVAEARRAAREEMPPLRGFRAAILGDAGRAWPWAGPGANAPETLRQAAELVGRELARDGLIATTAAALGMLDRGLSMQATVEHLRQVGIPVDLLAYFSAPAFDAEPVGPRIERTMAALRAGGSPPFHFAPSLPGFRVATESGETTVGLVRLQLTRGTDWAGPGDGGSVDLARQLAGALPGVGLVISIEERHVGDFFATARDWPGASRMTVVPELLPVAQWAQDNGKPGTVQHAGDARIATLVPRFATRGEVGPVFVPGETYLADGLNAAGLHVTQSPLLFQGGDLMAVHDPAVRQRVLLIGEANVYRNVGLGLSAAQVLDAYRIEFGVDRCVVLPAISFHIDYEVTVRAVGGRLTAFVNDPVSAARQVVACGIDVMAMHHRLGTATAAAAREHLRAGRDAACMALVAPALTAESPEPGLFRESLAAEFSVEAPKSTTSSRAMRDSGDEEQRDAIAFGGGPNRRSHEPDAPRRGRAGPASDSGVANLQHLLLAMDWLTATASAPGARGDDHAAAYARAIGRQMADRRRFQEQLGQLGWRVVSVPSFGDGKRSLNYLNGVQTSNAYLMPAYGGPFSGVDEAARQVFQRECGPGVRILPIICSESQRRDGAVHCSVGVYPTARGVIASD